ncbi:flagellar attachment zone protein 1-like isoform X1 [Acipenser ruthenus]|uniref:flagellar attachment zone protein 1-like isoform X1 n=1 Tax=Acipenser ruthenus TaxID=7906 RepID=UPI0027418EDD|nr:flagellar attachment zone protein 1-like isoform X1 [Acipenser ruthenus]
MEKIDAEIFTFQFNNMQFAEGRNETWLCQILCKNEEAPDFKVYKNSYWEDEMSKLAEEMLKHAEDTSNNTEQNPKLRQEMLKAAEGMLKLKDKMADMTKRAAEMIKHATEMSKHAEEMSKHATEMSKHATEMSKLIGKMVTFPGKMSKYAEKLRKLAEQMSKLPAKIPKHADEIMNLARMSELIKEMKTLAEFVFKKMSEYTEEMSKLAEEIAKLAEEKPRLAEEMDNLTYEMRKLKDKMLNVQEKIPMHADEICLWKNESKIQGTGSYKITWFISWSPCASCALQIIEFVEKHTNVSLNIFASRLYYYQYESHKEGFRKLAGHERIGLKVMTVKEFQDCFQQFVGFQKWDDLDKNSKFYAEELRSITGSDPVMPFEVPYSVCGVCLDY